jgi:hypothetical protein
LGADRGIKGDGEGGDEEEGGGTVEEGDAASMGDEAGNGDGDGDGDGDGEEKEDVAVGKRNTEEVAEEGDEDEEVANGA